MNYSYTYGSMYYEKYGTGEKSIVILPGWGETRATFSPMIEFLSQWFTIYIVDYPGFGESPVPSKDFTIYDYSTLIYHWMQSLELEDPILMGHSFGGRIIITLTGYYHYPFSHIILISAAGIKPRKTWKGKLRSAVYHWSQKLSGILPNPWKKKLRDTLFQKFSSEDYKNLIPTMRKTFQQVVSEDLGCYLKEIRSDVLLLWGTLDDATPLSDGKKMEKEIAESSLIEIQNTGHFCYLENATLIHRILYEYLKDVSS